MRKGEDSNGRKIAPNLTSTPEPFIRLYEANS